MPERFDPAAATKLDPRADFFDVSAIFGRPLALPLVRLLYPTPITPPQVTLAALAAGLAAAGCIARADHAAFIAGAILLQLKNVLDTADGHLARARRRPSWVGRYLDSAVDFAVNVAAHAALGIALIARGHPAGIWLWVALASLSAFLQCSTYVFYTVRYLSLSGRSPVSRADESAPPETALTGERADDRLLRSLHQLHRILYGWQDAAVRRMDGWWLELLTRRVGGRADRARVAAAWYANRRSLCWTSVLGLGTQLAAFSLALLADRPLAYLWIILAAGNAYLAAVMIGRFLAVGRALDG